MKTTNQEKQNTLGVKETQNRRESMELNSVVSFRLKNEDLKELREKARKDNRTLSSYLTNLIKTN